MKPRLNKQLRISNNGFSKETTLLIDMVNIRLPYLYNLKENCKIRVYNHNLKSNHYFYLVYILISLKTIILKYHING